MKSVSPCSMTHLYQSPTPTSRWRALRPLPRGATISILLLTWIASWWLSMLSFRSLYGGWELYVDRKVPIGTWFSYWVVYPVAVCPLALPVSTNRVITAMLSWLPIAIASPLALIASAAFWPVYITFLVLALRTGKRRYLAILGGMGLLASTHWHNVCMPWLGV